MQSKSKVIATKIWKCTSELSSNFNIIIMNCPGISIAVTISIFNWLTLKVLGEKT